LAYQNIPMKMTYLSDYGIRYFDYNKVINKLDDDPKDLILLHGLGASAERWLPVLPDLTEHFRVIVPDIIGFGYSDKPTVEYTMDFFIKFFKDFLENLDMDRPNIVGSSFGGHLATEFAIRYPNRIEKLILSAPAGMMRSSTHHLDQYIMAALYPTYENALRAFSDMAHDPNIVTEDTIKDFVNRMRLPNAKYAFMSTLLGIRDSPALAGRLSKIIAPTLLVWGDNDGMIPLQYSKGYINEIPHSNLVVMRNCGHTPYVENSIEFNREILKFLKD
jgi:2-hydroxy-6-oxonona-2,4-dienedioate hydrolase